MTIEIDDSGTGDLIGDAFIVFWRRETNDLVIKNIPLEIYQNPDFNQQAKRATLQIFQEAIKELDIPPTEEIYLCTGNIFDSARQFLRENSYNYRDSKIEGYLQDKVEQTYLDHIQEEFGIPKDIIPIESGRKRFFAQFNWIAEDFPRRIYYVKSGFEKWRTKWNKIANDQWMAAMVDINRDFEENNHHSPRRDYRRVRKSTHPTKSGNANRSSNQQTQNDAKPRRYPKKTTRPPGKNPAYRKRTGNPRSNRPHSNNQERDPQKKYSSTDPNPRLKFF